MTEGTTAALALLEPTVVLDGESEPDVPASAQCLLAAIS